MSSTETVFVVEDDPMYLHSVQELLRSHHLKTKGYATGEAFLADYRPELRGCLLLDVQLIPGMSGLELLEALRGRGWMIPTIMMTAYGTIPRAVRAMRLGALDFVEKPITSNSGLIPMIHDAISQESNSHQIQEIIAETGRRLATLNVREKEVLDFMVAAYSNREIADELNLSVRTIEHYRLGLLQKMDARNAGDLIRKTIQHSVATQFKVLPPADESTSSDQP